MERRNFLEKFGLGAAALGTLAFAPQAAFPTCPTPTPNRNSFRVSDFGATGDNSTDDTAAIQCAIDAAHSMGGGTIYMEGTTGRNFKCTGQLSFDDKRGVRLVGDTGPNGTSTTRLNYTGTASPFISMKSCWSITFESLNVSYSNTSFNGTLIATGWSGAEADPAYLLFDRCSFTGDGTANGADYLMDLSRCIISTIRNCAFIGSDIGFIGANSAYSNAIQVRDSTFGYQNVVAIKNAGEAWLISGCTFERLANGKSGAYVQGSGATSWGLTFIGCWMGDVSANGGCWLDMSQGGILGLTITGNRIAAAGAGSSDTSVKIGGSQGISITGNRIEGPIAIDFTSTAYGAAIVENDLQATTPIANLANAVPHFVAGMYTTENKIGGNTVFEAGTAIFWGDGSRGSLNLVPQTWGPPTTPQNGDLWSDNSGTFIKINGSIKKLVGGNSSSPTNGDVWSDNSGMYVRINGVTKTVTLT